MWVLLHNPPFVSPLLETWTCIEMEFISQEFKISSISIVWLNLHISKSQLPCRSSTPLMPISLDKLMILPTYSSGQGCSSPQFPCPPYQRDKGHSWVAKRSGLLSPPNLLPIRSFLWHIIPPTTIYMLSKYNINPMDPPPN